MESISEEFGFAPFRSLKPHEKEFLTSFYHPKGKREAPKQRKQGKVKKVEIKPKTGNPNFHVFMRVRPMSESASQRGDEISVRWSEDDESLMWVDKRNFVFDCVFPPGVEQSFVYLRAVEPLVQKALEGFNTTVFAYGVTGSGKTHTIYGPNMQWRGSHGGVIPRAIETVFNHIREFNQSEELQKFITVSHMECYQGEINDLFTENFSRLKVREGKDVGMYVEGLSEVEVNSINDLFHILEAGVAHRATASTELNSVSSRSHAIFTLNFKIRKQNKITNAGKINLCDLAGSERLSKSGATGEQAKNATFINSSLLALANVVRALVDKSGKKHIPYRDSVLTMLLKESLGGNSKTVMMSCISPDSSSVPETLRTVRFAAVATHIDQTSFVSSQIQNLKETDRMRQKLLAERKEALQAKSMQLNEEDVEALSALQSKDGLKMDEDGRFVLRTKFGEIPCRFVGPEDPAKGVAILVQAWADYDDCDWWEYMYKPLVDAGYRVLSFLYKYGDPLSPRSERNLDENGPCEILIEIMNLLGIKKATLLGYDWGGGICFSMCMAFKKRINSAVVFHPCYTLWKELKAVPHKLAIVCVKEDQNHPFSTMRKMHSALPKGELIKLSCGGFKVKKSIGVYHSMHEKISGAACEWLTKNHVVKKKKKKQKIVSSAPKELSAPAPPKKEIRPLGPEAAIQEIRKVWKSGYLPRFYAALLGKGSDLQLKPLVINLVGKLPIFAPSTMTSPAQLVKRKIWESGPANFDWLQTQSRYPPGRQILFRAPVYPFGTPTEEEYLRYDENLTENYVTHKAKIVEEAENHFLIEVLNVSNEWKRVEVPKEAVYELNNAHVYFGDDVSSRGVLFEDALKNDYTSLLCRLQSLEICFALEEIVKEMDFKSKNVLNLQIECIKRLRQVLNITPIQSGLVRTRNSRSRDASKLVCYGQGHCHGVTSCMAAYFSVFAPLLGIDQRYRSGYVFYEDERQGDLVLESSCVKNNYDRHHWNEFTCFPSARSFTCDLSRCGKHPFALSELAQPISESYSMRGNLYPAGKFLFKSRYKEEMSS